MIVVLHFIGLGLLFFAFRITYQAGRYNVLKNLNRELNKDTDEY